MCFFPRVLLLLFILILLLVNCCQSQSNNSSSLCVSSCGNIKNISNPFRLKSDPKYCGNPEYELDCQNNQTVLTYSYPSRYYEMEYSQKYLVQSISYNNLTIRVVDPGLIHTTNCSLPVNSFANDSFNSFSSSEYLLEWHSTKKMEFPGYYNNAPIVAVFISCVEPISYSSSYIDISICRGRNTNWNPSSTYVYFGVVNIHTEISELPETCGIEEIAFASVNGPLAENNYSTLLDIHQGLAYGFELSWYPTRCKDLNCSTAICYPEGNSAKVTCDTPCPGYIPFLRVHLWPFLIHFHTFSGQSKSFRAKIVPGRPPTFSCYFWFWAHGLGELMLIFIVVLLVLRFFIGFVCVMVLVVHKWRRRHLSGDETIEDFLQGQTNILPIKYSYSDIKKMTNKFKQKLGEGGYGIVYKGKLRSGPLVAVKMTNKSISSEREFSNEVGTIGRVHHVNVVQLIGFCTEGSKRALVYEYMPNGSLDKYISPIAGQGTQTYKNMFDISLVVARGIDYLHKGCDMQILHFDIKPHNILLDEDFKAKISDFGLAKLYPTDVNTVTLPTITARGTTGYMAPELFYKNTGGVSYKADVYSFGMMLMELASRKENINPFAEDDSQIYFPSWVYDQLNVGNEIDMENVSDKERMMVKKMIKVALWCIQMKPANRPSMNKVVEMLEGDAELIHMPPRPFIYCSP